MWEFNRIYRNIESAMTDAAQFTELLLDPPAVVDADRAAGVRAARLRRRAAERDVPVLAGAGAALRAACRCAIESGTKVGFVGRSGGGKTTLTRLLLRFLDVSAGEILIGGQPIDRVPQAALRQAIGYVPQDPSMFHRTIADNIRFGRPEATDAEVRARGPAGARGRVHRRAAGAATRRSSASAA